MTSSFRERRDRNVAAERYKNALEHFGSEDAARAFLRLKVGPWVRRLIDGMEAYVEPPHPSPRLPSERRFVEGLRSFRREIGRLMKDPKATALRDELEEELLGILERTSLRALDVMAPDQPPAAASREAIDRLVSASQILGFELTGTIAAAAEALATGDYPRTQGVAASWCKQWDEELSRSRRRLRSK